MLRRRGTSIIGFRIRDRRVGHNSIDINIFLRFPAPIAPGIPVTRHRPCPVLPVTDGQFPHRSGNHQVEVFSGCKTGPILSISGHTFSLEISPTEKICLTEPVTSCKLNLGRFNGKRTFEIRLFDLYLIELFWTRKRVLSLFDSKIRSFSSVKLLYLTLANCSVSAVFSTGGVFYNAVRYKDEL